MPQDSRLIAFNRLLDIMDELRAKCPWDKKQTMESLRHLTLEESFELSDAIMEGDLEDVKKELGDIILHIVFYAKIGEEKKAFNITDVLNGICEKLIHRHPHIYGDVEVNSEEEVKANWEKIKLKEGNGKKSVLEGVPGSMPSLLKAVRIQDKVRGVGFDWEKREDVLNKVLEEIHEFEEEVKIEDNHEKIEEEFGDILFALVNYSRFCKINPDDALERTNRKFIKRFKYLEGRAREEGKKLENMTLAEMDVYWEESKQFD